MNAEIVAVGSEMLTPQRIDTNSLFITDQLNSLGIEVVQKCIVGDDRDRLAEVVRIALARSNVIIITGGLGPTEDDVTRDAVAAALGRGLHFDQHVCDAISERFRRFNRKMAEINKRQAYIIDGAEVLPNDRGTAPGQWIDSDNRVIVLLPGPPKELMALWERQCMPRLQARMPAQVIRTRFYRVAGMTESDVDQTIAPIYTKYANPACTILAATTDIQVHLRARCDCAEQADALLHEVGSQIEAVLGLRLYTCVGEPIEACVGKILTERGQTLAVAESCTGGTLGERLTQVSGSSRYFSGGFITYSNDAKIKLLGLDSGLLENEGPVSAATAHAMAEATRQKLSTDYALSVTGIAGPDGGTEQTPVGTVFIGLATPSRVFVKNVRLPGDRDRVRIMAAQTALDLLRLELMGVLFET